MSSELLVRKYVGLPIMGLIPEHVYHVRIKQERSSYLCTLDFDVTADDEVEKSICYSNMKSFNKNFEEIESEENEDE